MIRRQIPALCAIVALSGWSLRGAAADACRIHVSPPDAATTWTLAVEDAQKTIDATESTAHDCRRIDLAIAGDKAILTFVTVDGRTATRAVDAPSQLRSVVEGLLITFPAAPAPVAEETPAIVAPAPSPIDALPKPAPSPEAKSDRHAILSANAGARIGFPRTFVGPSIGTDVSALFGRWEVGSLILFEPATYEISPKTPDGFRTSTLGVGLAFGRREPIGDAQILYALDVALVRTDSVGDHSTGKVTSDLRIGALAGVVWPLRASYRLRPQIQFDYNPTRHQQALIADALSPLPRWGLGLTLGVETTFL